MNRKSSYFFFCSTSFGEMLEVLETHLQGFWACFGCCLSFSFFVGIRLWFVFFFIVLFVHSPFYSITSAFVSCSSNLSGLVRKPCCCHFLMEFKKWSFHSRSCSCCCCQCFVHWLPPPVDCATYLLQYLFVLRAYKGGSMLFANLLRFTFALSNL